MCSATTHVGDARKSCIRIVRPPLNIEDMDGFKTGVEEAITSDDVTGELELRVMTDGEPRLWKSVLYSYCRCNFLL